MFKIADVEKIQYNFRIEKDLKKKIAVMAIEEGVSQNTMTNYLLRKAIDQEK